MSLILTCTICRQYSATLATMFATPVLSATPEKPRKAVSALQNPNARRRLDLTSSPVALTSTTAKMGMKNQDKKFQRRPGQFEKACIFMVFDYEFWTELSVLCSNKYGNYEGIARASDSGFLSNTKAANESNEFDTKPIFHLS